MQRFLRSERIVVFVSGLCLALITSTVYAMPDGQAMLTRTLFKQLDELHDELRLSSEQESLWQSARMHSKQAERDIRENNRRFTRLSEQELASDAPRLSELSAALDDLLKQNQAMHKEVRTLWLGFYDGLAASQKRVVRDALQRQLARLKTFQQLRDFFGGN